MSITLSQAMHPMVSVVPAREIATLEGAAQALARADTLTEIKQIRDKAEAVRKYAQLADLGYNLQNQAAELKLRAERKAGELLRTLRLRGGDRKSDSRHASLKLQDMGINKDQSARWQLQSKLPRDKFESYLRTTKEAGGDIVAADVLRLATAFTKHRAGAGPTMSPACKAKTSRGYSPATKYSSPAERHLSNRCVEKPSKFEEVLEELENHRGLIDNILRPVYTEVSSAIELLPAERRVLGRLLKEMANLLVDLQKSKS